MPRHQWTWLVGAAAVLFFAPAWAMAASRSPKKPVDWTALNRAFAGATFVKDADTCRGCHEDYVKTYGGTTHSRMFSATPPQQTGECESCHGPRSKHVAEPSAELKLTPRAQSAVCLQCHQNGQRMGWKAGAHHASDLGCTSCHTLMQKKSEQALLARQSVPETCYQCHAEVRTAANKMSHHPIREGRMDCASCHNPHGSNPSLLAKSTLNETCYSCHAEKRGPFVWEHAPARENCANCHTPHGSNQRNLLTSKDPFLCLSCHSYGGHINLPRYNRVSNPYGNGCSNCHISTHGSNHPSGAKLTR